MDRLIDALVRVWELIGGLSPAFIVYLLYRAGCLERKLKSLQARIVELEQETAETG